MKDSGEKDYNFIRELCAGDSRITICGGSEIMVENHKGIIEVDSCSIRLLTKKQRITINGSGLGIICYNAEDIVVGGHIESVVFEARG